jgi:hypothetical protein
MVLNDDEDSGAPICLADSCGDVSVNVIMYVVSWKLSTGKFFFLVRLTA